MEQCTSCRHAEWDFEEYYGGGRQWFVCGCKKDEAPEECEAYDYWVEAFEE